MKPLNIFKVGEFYKIADLGISKNLGNTVEMARTCCGTPLFMAPEIIQMNRYDYKCDIWALGVILYLMKTFKLPYDDESSEKLINKIKNYDPTPISDKSDQLLNLMIMSMIYKNPTDRPSAKDLIKFPGLRKYFRELENELKLPEYISCVLDNDTTYTDPNKPDPSVGEFLEKNPSMIRLADHMMIDLSE